MKNNRIIGSLSISIILFTLVTKWWYVVPVDGRETSMLGFPLPYSAEAWHTSMARQYFAVEFLVDFSLYFLLSWALMQIITRRTIGGTWMRGLRWSVFIIAVLLLLMNLLWILQPNNLFYWTRDFEYELIDSGIQWWWGNRI